MAEGADEPLYRIVSGVHRCVAAREAGLVGIFAEILDEAGRIVRRERVLLAQIHSPKSEIDRWDRNRDFAELIEIMKSVEGRAAIEPVTLSLVSVSVAKHYVKLTDVMLTGFEEGET